MRTSAAALGSALFFLAAPVVVAGVLPWWLAGWSPGRTAPPLAVLGGVLVAGGAAVVGDAFVRFVRDGRGTPAPVAPTERLVVGGLYRFVRNPMYVGVVTAIVGQALLLGRLSVWLYAGLAWLVMAAFVRWHEEPNLRARFGIDYEAYKHAVPAWVPRTRPWEP
ncbi:MAG TPA: isoprenylcysteine carboxylmethyltransferase family protein [Actinophytocola sp.]|uniref:methyltransferase family protein n=1 Tax=Actinophytocola sp. TaxID=1872138 RepID=UPI002DC000AE|nr:isoprenylcysteine carboxylmethyltransferase family protein [Actinophytocola sp.]HEU5473906.1 isoprenylcysteine carboxylmethyltransferase family protein [Actinophytocola sp.]